jgi:DNA/RNA endonuclease G (NUC1)
LAVHEFLDKTIVEGSASRKGKDFVQQTEGVDPEDLKFFIDTSYYEKTDAYNKLGYDKGHMAPAKNYSGDQKLLDSTYTFANCIPQNYYFNRGSWKNLESYCRNLIRNDVCETIEIVSGPVFYSGLPHKKLANTFENQQVVML